MRRYGLALSLAFFCAGCGTVSFLASSSTAGTDTPVLFYHSYGDSITVGDTLPDRSTQNYPGLVSQAYGLPLLNYAGDSNMACDVPKLQIFPAEDNPTTISRGLYSIMISTNDIQQKGPGPYEAIFNLCHQASIAWLAVPTEYKVLVTTAGVSASGPGAIDATNHWNAWITGAAGASITFPVHLAVAGPVYAWYRIGDNAPGTFIYTVDGKQVGSGTTGVTPSMSTVVGTTDSLGLIRIPSVASGNHTIGFDQTSSGIGGMAIVAVGVPPPGHVLGLPHVIVGTTPKQLPGGAGACATNDAPCQAYITDIKANVALFAGDGLDVELFDSRKYMSGTTADMSDAVHPNVLGQMEIAHSVADVLNQTMTH